jgi:peptidoglycan/LPS O-acetylase OafA/YrhL
MLQHNRHLVIDGKDEVHYGQDPICCPRAVVLHSRGWPVTRRVADPRDALSRRRPSGIVAIPESNLDILRSFAVLCVASAHLYLAIRGERVSGATWSIVNDFGRFGVLIFFVHTTLVLMLSMERMRDTGISLVCRFYVRRAFRIYPLSILLCVLVSLFAIPRSVTPAFVWSPRIFASNVLLVQNITHDPPLNVVLWSLPYEVQMYLVLPFVFMALRRKHWAAILFVFFVVGAVGGYRFTLLEFVPCFLAGAHAWKVSRLVRPLFSWEPWPLLLCLFLAMYCFYQPGGNSRQKEWLTCIALGVSIPLFAECGSTAIAAAAKTVARYSYGIYLFHLPLMWIFYRKLASFPWVWRNLGFGLAMFVVPALCYRVVEAPLIGVGIRISKRLFQGGRTTANRPLARGTTA